MDWILKQIWIVTAVTLPCYWQLNLPAGMAGQRSHLTLNALDIMYNEKEIIGTVGQHQLREFKWAFQYLADGRVNPESMIIN